MLSKFISYICYINLYIYISYRQVLLAIVYIFVPFGIVDTNLLILLVLFQDGQASFIPFLEMHILVSDMYAALGSIEYNLNH